MTPERTARLLTLQCELELAVARARVAINASDEVGLRDAYVDMGKCAFGILGQPQTFDFGGALHQLKRGRRVARRGWNGKGAWLVLVTAEDWGSLVVVGKSGPVGMKMTQAPWIGMRTADNHFVPWLCSQTDALADDYEVVP